MEDEALGLGRGGKGTRRGVLLCHGHNVVIRVAHVNEGGSINVGDGRVAAGVLLGNHVCSEGISTLSRHIRTIR